MLVPTMHVGVGSEIGPLTVFPVWTDHGSDTPPLGAAELEVSELQPPAVEHLLVTNPGAVDALLIEGEVLQGGKQHRVVDHDVIIPAGTTLTIDVVCVEQGRWSQGHGHRREHRRATARVRDALLDVDPSSRQRQVWHRVAAYDGALASSPTDSLLDHLDALTGPAGRPSGSATTAESNVDEVVTAVERMRPLPGQNGVLVGVDGQPVVLEVFADATALAAHLNGTLTGVLMDAVAAGRDWIPTPSRRARRMAARVSGLDLQASTGRRAGAGLSYGATHHMTAVLGVESNGVWAHLTAVQRDHVVLHG